MMRSSIRAKNVSFIHGILQSIKAQLCLVALESHGGFMQQESCMPGGRRHFLLSNSPFPGYDRACRCKNTHMYTPTHKDTHTHTRACMQEQDFLIDFMRRMHETHSCLEVMTKMEKWINEHRKDPQRSRLKRLVPQLGQFFTPLLLVDAFHVGPCKDVFLVCLCVCVCECVFAQLFVAQLH